MEQNLISDKSKIEVFRGVMEQSTMVPEELWLKVAEKIYVHSCEKNTTVLESGKYEQVVRFILKGVVKLIFEGNKSYVYDFRTGMDFLCDTVSLLQRVPTNYTYITLTDCEWLEIKGSEFFALLNSHEKVKLSMAENINKYLQRNQEMTTFLRTLNAEERYEQFCMKYPEVNKYVKLGDIASFLGITQQSLSRIRKGISR